MPGNTHKTGISEHQVERAILVYAAEVQWNWATFLQEAAYNIFGHLAAGIIVLRHGSVGLSNRGFDCNMCGSGGVVVLLQWSTLVIMICSIALYMLGRNRFGDKFEMTEAEIMLALGLNIMRCLTIATKYGFMPSPVYNSMDKASMPVEQRTEYLLLGGWWMPSRQLLYREMEKASARHDAEFDTRLVVFETREAKAAALDAVRKSLGWFLKMESGRLAPDIEEDLRYVHTAWDITCQRQQHAKQRQLTQNAQLLPAAPRRAAGVVTTGSSDTPGFLSELAHTMQPPATASGWVELLSGGQHKDRAMEEGDRGQSPPSPRGSAGSPHATSTAPEDESRQNPLLSAVPDSKSLKKAQSVSMKPTPPAVAVAAARGVRAQAAAALQQQRTNSALCSALDNTETGRDIWKKAMAARHAIPAKLIAWHTVEQCYRQEPPAWLSVMCKVVALLFAVLPSGVRLGLGLPPVGSSWIATGAILGTMLLSAFCAHTTALYCCVGALDASRRLQVQLAMSELINLKRDGVADARMMVQSVQAELACERRQAEAAARSGSSCDCMPADRRRSSGPGWERRSTQELSTELRHRVMARSTEHANAGTGVAMGSASGGPSIATPMEGGSAPTGDPEERDLEGRLSAMTALPRSRRRLSVLRDMAPGIEVDSDEEEDGEGEGEGEMAATGHPQAKPAKSGPSVLGISSRVSSRGTRRVRGASTNLSNALLRVGGRQMAPPARSELLESGAQLSQRAAASFVREELRTLRLPLLRPGNVEAWYQARRVCLDTGRLFEQRITINGGLYLTFALVNLVVVLVLVFTEAAGVVRLAEAQEVGALPLVDRVSLARFGALVGSCLLLELLFSLTTIAQVVLGALSNEEGIVHCDRIVQAEAVVTELRYSPPTVLMLLAAKLARRSVERAQERLRAVADACNVAARRIRSELDVEPMRILGLPASFALVSTIVSAAGSGVVAASSAISDSVSPQ